QQVVEQMALGVQKNMQTDYAIATSGVAGPTGGSAEKPVGTVWIAVATPDGVNSKKYQFGKLRDVNIERAAMTALGMLRKRF
ncbi:MAG: CinA family protein, partial [Flavobacteriaceae bacterium]